jgi:hypothetical protein
LLASGCGSAPRQAAKTGPFRGAGHALAGRYLAIAIAGNRRLNTDFDGLEHGDWKRLARARADLRNAAATERLFDRRILRIRFPHEIERVARSLYRVNQARARLTAAAGASPSVLSLDRFKQRLKAANRPVEHDVKTIRRELGLPPPPTS